MICTITTVGGVKGLPGGAELKLESGRVESGGRKCVEKAWWQLKPSIFKIKMGWKPCEVTPCMASKNIKSAWSNQTTLVHSIPEYACSAWLMSIQENKLPDEFPFQSMCASARVSSSTMSATRSEIGHVKQIRRRACLCYQPKGLFAGVGIIRRIRATNPTSYADQYTGF